MSDIGTWSGQLAGGVWSLVAFIVLLGIIITVHEWGHYFVARRCGVKVLRFSIGFGKPLWMRVGSDGTEYVVAAIPLGGFVRMLDEREGEVPADQLAFAFNRKPVAQRFAIVAAGPLVNLLFAVLLYWGLFVAGSQQLAPVIGSVEKKSPAAVAGMRVDDEVLTVDDIAVRSWDDIALRVVAWVGDSGDIRFVVRSGAAGIERDIAVPVAAFMRGQESSSPMRALGIAPWLPPLPATVGAVMPELEQNGRKVSSPAQIAGLRQGDRIVSVDGVSVVDWNDWVEVVRASPDQALALDIARGDGRLQLTLTPLRMEQGGRAVGVAGIGMAPLRWPQDWPAEYVRDIRYGPMEAIGQALFATWDRSVLTVVSIGRMVSGKMSADSIGGPISIAQGAGATASGGLAVYLGFVAFLSISIGILNLLPIPVLDGGHLVFYLYEMVRGKPVPERVQAVALQVGVALLVGLMALAFFNDFARL